VRGGGLEGHHREKRTRLKYKRNEREEKQERTEKGNRSIKKKKKKKKKDKSKQKRRGGEKNRDWCLCTEKKKNCSSLRTIAFRHNIATVNDCTAAMLASLSSLLLLLLLFPLRVSSIFLQLNIGE
jgi:hypothetical protein